MARLRQLWILTDMFIWIKRVLAVASISLIIFSSSEIVQSEGDLLKYPGNGVPYFSKNIEIRALRDEIVRYSASFSSIDHQEGKFTFHDVNNYKFVSTQRISGEKFNLGVDLAVDKGNCIIEVGDVRYKVTSGGIVIENDDKVVYSNNATRIRSITIESFTDHNFTTRLHTDNKLIGIFKIHISMPAMIGIHLNDDFNGYIGPWLWLRGYM
jgi:hypothetical protein